MLKKRSTVVPTEAAEPDASVKKSTRKAPAKAAKKAEATVESKIPLKAARKPAASRKPKTAVPEFENTSSSSMANLAQAMQPAVAVDAEEVARRAYLYWLERGCPEGSAAEDWFRAEQALSSELVCAR